MTSLRSIRAMLVVETKLDHPRELAIDENETVEEFAERVRRTIIEEASA